MPNLTPRCGRSDEGPIRCAACTCHSQVISLGADSVIKVHDLRTNLCLQTIAAHDWPAAADAKPAALLYDARRRCASQHAVHSGFTFLTLQVVNDVRSLDVQMRRRATTAPFRLLGSSEGGH